MSVILLILSGLVTGAGILAVGFGIPINEFNLGNTLIVSGTIACGAGLILFGLAAAVDQLTRIARALQPRAAAGPATRPQAADSAAASARPGPAPGPLPNPAKVAMPAPPRNPVFAKLKAEEPEPTPVESAAEVSSSAIERLRSSLGRADRKVSEPVDPVDAKDTPYVAPGAGPRLGANTGANGAAPTGGSGATEAVKKPPLDFLFRSKAREPQPEAFDAVWPKRGQLRSDEQPGADVEAPSEQPYSPPASAPDELRPAAILKSGVVDGMAYTLYADGSIEAQLPQGTVRFRSIAELRSHIENNS